MKKNTAIFKKRTALFNIAFVAAGLQKNYMSDTIHITNPFYRRSNIYSYRGNINISVTKIEKGRTIMLQRDITSLRVYSRIHMISATKDAAQKYPLPKKKSLYNQWLNNKEMEKINNQYKPEIVKRIGRWRSK